MEREKFEESLRNAFDKAEVSPSARVWTNIELDLEKEKGGHLKRRVLFYQLVAAASVVFAMAVGAIGYYNGVGLKDPSIAMHTPDPVAGTHAETDGKSSPQDMNTASAEDDKSANLETDITSSEPKRIASAKENSTAPPQQDKIATEDDTSDETARPVDDISVPGTLSDEENVFRNSLSDAGRRENDKIAGQQSTIDNGDDMTSNVNTRSAFGANAETALASALPTTINARPLPPLYTPEKFELDVTAHQKKVDPVAAMLAGLEQREKELQGEERIEDRPALSGSENLWTSVGFAAGSFSSVATTASSPPPSNAFAMATALTAPIVNNETKASGYTYSMGVNVGTKLSERWVFQGGVNYLTHLSEYTANNVVVAPTTRLTQRFRAATTNELYNADEAELSNKLVYSAPYNVNNSMRYLSIPMQAGYLLVNKTFGLQLNAGVATDLFLRNTVEADSDQLDKTSQAGGPDSPYRTVNLSGLLGTEFSYRFGQNYRISLNPGIRYPFNTIYKSELGVQSTPLTFDVGLRFRYIFH